MMMSKTPTELNIEVKKEYNKYHDTYRLKGYLNGVFDGYYRNRYGIIETFDSYEDTCIASDKFAQSIRDDEEANTWITVDSDQNPPSDESEDQPKVKTQK